MKNLNLIKRLLSDSHEKQKPQRFGRYAAMLIMLLTLGVGQMWADPWVCRSTDGGKKATKTVGDKLNGGTEWKYQFTVNQKSWSSGDVQVYVGISTSHYKTVNAVWESDGAGDNRNVKGDIGNIKFDKSGNWYAVGKFSQGGKTAYTTTKSSWTDNSTLSFGNNSEPYWQVNPPAVKSGTISISATNTATGSGTGLSAESPIILTSGSASRLTISATQNVSDANSSLYCKFGSGSYSSTVTYDIAANTLTSNQTLALAVKYYNSSASLSGTESTATIYYKWEEAPAVVLTASKTSGINVGEAITLTATGSYASNITQYEFYEGSTKIATVSAPTNTYSYTPTTVGGKTMKVVMTYNSGSNTVTSANLALSLNTPSVSLAVKAGSSSSFHLGEGSTILKATPSNVGASVTPSYVFTDQIAGGNGVTSASQTGTEWTYNPSATGQAKTRTMKVTMSVGGGTYTGTVSVTVYEKFTVHIKNTDSWSAMYLYMWDGGTYNKAWPGVQQTAYNGSSKWYNVVLDTRYTSFIISQGNDTKKSGTISMLAASNAGNCYTTTTGTSLPSTTCPSAPSVTTAAASSVAATSVKFNASSVSDNSDDITAYGFKWGTTSACSSGTVTASNLGTGTTFSATKSSLTNGTTYYFKAYATNAQGTTYGDPVSVRTKFVTTVTLNKQGGTDGTSEVSATEGSAMPSGKTAPNKTGYTFGGYYASAGGSGTQYYNSSMGSAHAWDVAASTATIHAKWTANPYTINLNHHSPTTAASINSINVTFDASTNLTGTVMATRPTKTGYNFGGYWTGENGTGVKILDTDGTIVASASGGGNTYTDASKNWKYPNNITLHAYWNPKQSALTFDYQTSATGYGTSGSISAVSATYGVAMPALTGSLPTAANGYAFMGFYDATGGGGTRYYDGSGNSVRTWNKNTESGTTLYAYYKKAEITNVALNATTFEPVAAGDEGYVVANPTIDPTPVAPTKICWELLYDNDNPVTGRTVIPDPEVGKLNQVKFSIAGLAAGGYKVRATLYTGDGACGSGTTLSVQEASFTIASDFTVTILYKCGDATIKSSTTNPGKPLVGTSITAPDIIGYTFSKWKAGDGVTIDGADASGEKATATITYTANYNGSLTAIYTKKRVIYFYNTLSWSNVYVYFYSGSYWNNDNGTGSNSGGSYTGINGQMQPISEGSRIYYFDAEEAGVNASYTYVSFTELHQNNTEFFTKTGTTKNKVVYRDDYKSTTLPMFVPSTQTPEDKNGNAAKYYNEGYWMNYPENTGYTLRIYDNWNADNATGASREYLIPYSSDKKMPLKQDVEINFSGKTWFLIYRNDGNYLAGSHTFKQTDHNDYAMSSTDNAGSASKMILLSDGEGIYTFNLSYHGDGANPENFHYYLNVDFPAALGDYRIVYKDNAEWSQGSAHTSSWYHPSKVIPKIKGDATEAKKDTVSFFVAKGDGITATMKFQYISAINASTGAVTWTDVASGSITIPSSITTSGVYNFIVTQPIGGASISLEKTEAYEGNYYIRTDNAGDTKWNNYRSRDHQMVYTEFSRNRATNTFGELYTHYFTSWCERGTNIKFCIANDYSPCISDTLGQDVGNPYSNTDTGGNLHTDGATLPIDDKYSANVRFMYNETTNKICRAYVGSSTNPARKFLMLEGNVELHGDDDEAITDWDPRYALILADKQNWIYEHVLKIKPKTRFKLYACYAQTTVSPDGAQYFRGAYDSNQFTSDDNSVILIDGAGDADYQMARIIYDFKTNRLMTAWIPSGSNVSGNMEINADVLVEREHQEPAQYITFENASSQLSGVKTVYGAMKFNRWILNNRGGSSDVDPNHGKTAEQIATHHAPLPVGQQKSIYERSLYFISFPFDVNASEIFGFGHYWDEWYLEYYDGLTRAKNGYWEDSPPNWKYVMPSMLNDFVLKANEGYILGLDLDFMKADNFDFWSNGISTVELFFPSKTTQETLKQTNCTIPALGDEYRCKINRGTTEGDRRVKDSYWRCLGVPSFNIYNTLLLDGSGNPITWQPSGNTLPFIYAWNKADNTLTAQSTSTFTFLPMHAYLVQNGGEIRWTNVSAKPASPIVARRVNEQPATEYEWRLALTSDSVLIDQTYVKMSNIEQVTDTFDFNQDMIKEFNPYRSDIYTYIGYERVAANSMPLQTEQTTVIPVGVKIKNAGDYTFAMPDGTNGVGVTLVDTQTGVRTNLGLMDYTVTLTAGSFNQRFVLEISPIMQTPTDFEEVTGDGLQVTGVRKVLIDQKMYIIRDGKVYDARGAKVK